MIADTDHRTDSIRKDGWEPGIDLAGDECLACGRDAIVAVLAPAPHRRNATAAKLCCDCLLSAAAMIEEDAR
jgi:hypothetical protein